MFTSSFLYAYLFLSSDNFVMPLFLSLLHICPPLPPSPLLFSKFSSSLVQLFIIFIVFTFYYSSPFLPCPSFLLFTSSFPSSFLWHYMNYFLFCLPVIFLCIFSILFSLSCLFHFSAFIPFFFFSFILLLPSYSIFLPSFFFLSPFLFSYAFFPLCTIFISSRLPLFHCLSNHASTTFLSSLLHFFFSSAIIFFYLSPFLLFLFSFSFLLSHSFLPLPFPALILFTHCFPPPFIIFSCAVLEYYFSFHRIQVFDKRLILLLS